MNDVSAARGFVDAQLSQNFCDALGRASVVRTLLACLALARCIPFSLNVQRDLVEA